ncbi:hypothetical protein M0802_009173 [Mischocyttarus mexicanus]|nr:hypothetical protein M0802_009173 [Mischocyttarus mexicanus]
MPPNGKKKDQNRLLRIENKFFTREYTESHLFYIIYSLRKKKKELTPAKGGGTSGDRNDNNGGPVYTLLRRRWYLRYPDRDEFMVIVVGGSGIVCSGRKKGAIVGTIEIVSRSVERGSWPRRALLAPSVGPRRPGQPPLGPSILHIACAQLFFVGTSLKRMA